MNGCLDTIKCITFTAKMGSIPSQEICTFRFWLTLAFSGSIRLIYAPLWRWHLIIILLQYHMVTSIKYSSTHHPVIRGFWHFFILKPYIILNIHVRPSSNCSFNNHHSVANITQYFQNYYPYVFGTIPIIICELSQHSNRQRNKTIKTLICDVIN